MTGNGGLSSRTKREILAKLSQYCALLLVDNNQGTVLTGRIYQCVPLKEEIKGGMASGFFVAAA
jgi:hypothetical protein